MKRTPCKLWTFPHWTVRTRTTRNGIEEMLLMNDIESALSEWAFTILFAPKSCSLLICTLYRKLNAELIKNVYPIQQMHEWLDSLGGAHMLLMSSVNPRYCKIEIVKRDKDKATFTATTDCTDFCECSPLLKNCQAQSNKQWTLRSPELSGCCTSLLGRYCYLHKVHRTAFRPYRDSSGIVTEVWCYAEIK